MNKNKKPETRSRHVGKQTFHCFRDRRANADNDTLSASLSLPYKAAHNVITRYVKLLFFVASGHKKTALKGLSFA